jgi:hypothetical protein
MSLFPFHFGADGYSTGAAWGPRLFRGGAHADHARTDRSRARQCALIHVNHVLSR